MLLYAKTKHLKEEKQEHKLGQTPIPIKHGLKLLENGPIRFFVIREIL